MEKYLVSRVEMSECAQQLLQLPVRVWTFTGTLGAGKTTLVQEMLTQLGVQGPIQSPTYTYVSTYQLPDGRVVHHFDLYRLSCAQEFVQAGFDEYLYDDAALCFIEWPDIIQDSLPKATARVVLEYAADEKRLITVE